VFVIGSPGPVGGADTELWHTLRLWRSRGLAVAVVPTWGIGDPWRAKCRAIGCEVHAVPGPGELLDVPGLRGAIVVSFCNDRFLAHAATLRRAGCKTVWANCMTWLFEAEGRHYAEHGPFDHYVFQSRYQRSKLVPLLKEHGYRDRQGSVIRGAFWFDDFPFRPLAHEAKTPLVVGRISRADTDKYSVNTWPIYRRIPHPIRARLMAWDRRIEKKLGPPPPWAECLPANAEPAPEFFGKLHAMLQVNGQAEENWPRSGLEAMATGVPVVVQNAWGWREMVRHGRTGFLASNDEELAYYAARLAYDEDFRLRMAARARRALEDELANPDVLWAAWQSVFASLGRKR
jgi:hypothetical protein